MASQEIDRNELTIFIIILLVCVTVTQAPSSSIRLSRFHREVKPSHGPRRLSPVWNTTSRTACGHRCISQHGSKCRNFLYNSATGRCTPGSAVVASQPPPNSTEGELYRDVFPCDTSKDFYLKTLHQTRACVGKFNNPKLTYSKADVQCQTLGGFLMSVKTKDKLEILHDFSVPGDDKMWVGCDDRKKEGDFVWKEDGELTTSEMFDDLFHTKPSHGAIEDCIRLEHHHLGYDDCSTRHSYMCELPLS